MMKSLLAANRSEKDSFRIPHSAQQSIPIQRIYADGILVEYNFWNGKPTLVRLSDLIGKHVELKIPVPNSSLSVAIFSLKGNNLFH